MPKIDIVNANNVIEYSPEKAYFKLKNTGGPKGDKGDTGAQGPKGDTGPQGPAGLSSSVTVGSTTTLSPGADATVTNSGDTRNAILNFGIPTGAQGPQGIQGPKGDTGPMGEKGAKGDTGAAATVQVGNTNTGAPGTNAQVTNAGNEHFAVLNFTIPRGDKGATGATGPQGPTGADGYSPSATVTQEGLNANISITDKSGTTTATVPGFGVQVVDSLPATGSENVIYLERSATEATGNPITVTDAVAAPLVDYEILGNTTQDTLSGKNKIGLTPTTFDASGVTVTVGADGVITFNGTATSAYNQSNKIAISNTPQVAVGDTVTYSYYYISGTSSSDSQTAINLRSSETSTGYEFQFNSSYVRLGMTDASTTITATDSGNTRRAGYITFVQIFFPSGQAFNNFKIKLQLETGSTSTAYEPYCGGIPSPNPNYPQTVNTVTGENTVQICGKNLFDKTAVSTGYINADTTLSSDSSYRTSDYIPVIPNTAYYKTLTQSPRTKYFDINKKPLNTTTYQDISIGGNAGTFTTPNNAAYLRFSFPVSSGGGGTPVDINTVQIELGSTASTYEAYQGQSYEVNLGKNLFDKDNAQTIMLNVGNTLTDSPNNKSLYIPCEPNTTYTVQKRNDGDTNRFAVATTSVLPANGVSTSGFIQDNNASSITITTASSAKYLIVMYYRIQETILTEQQLLDSIQIEKGSQATSYAPYFTPIELCKIDTYQDYIRKDGDTWKVHKALGKIICDGSETGWSRTVINGVYRFVRALPGALNAEGRSTYFKTSHFHYLASGNEVGGAIFNAGNIGLMYSTVDTSIEQFSTWLSTNNVSIYYAIATPTDTEITNQALIAQLDAILANAKTYAGTTNISLVATAGNASGELQVTYYDSYSSYLYVNGRWEKFAMLTGAN